MGTSSAVYLGLTALLVVILVVVRVWGQKMLTQWRVKRHMGKEPLDIVLQKPLDVRTRFVVVRWHEHEYCLVLGAHGVTVMAERLVLQDKTEKNS